MRLYKGDARQTIERLTAFWKRKAQDRILFWALVRNPSWDRYLEAHGYPPDYRVAAPGHALTYFPEGVPGRRTECLCLCSPQQVMEMIDAQQKLCAELDDDSLPVGYPNLHFGEGVFAGFIGAPVQFSGNGVYTWSAAEKPPLQDWDELETVLARPIQEPWGSSFAGMARYAAEHANGCFGLRTFICVDALNLAVEWRGSTTAYLDLHDAPDCLQRIMERGVTLNAEMVELERREYREYNRRTFEDEEFCALAPAFETPILGVDAYTLTNPLVYRDLGMAYQQRLIDILGGCHMHMHGTRLYKLLPLVAQLRGLISIELADDGLREGEPPPIDCLRHIRDQITGDIPLIVHCTREQFVTGLADRSLAGGVEYCVRGVQDVNDANVLAARARDYIAR